MVLQGTTVIKIAFIKLKVIILIVLNQYTKARMYLIVSVGRARFSALSYYSAAAGQAGRSGKSKLFELLILKKKKKKDEKSHNLLRFFFLFCFVFLAKTFRVYIFHCNYRQRPYLFLTGKNVYSFSSCKYTVHKCSGLLLLLSGNLS